jgi:hypothetical protein
LVWRPRWISGGYRLEAASRPIALYIVGIREAQGRNQHFESGTGTWSSGFWLAMADCLGRFGRASHSTSRYQTPPRSWDKSKCMFNAKPESQALLPLLCSPASILQDDASSLIAEPLLRLPSAPVRRMFTRHDILRELLQALYVATLHCPAVARLPLQSSMLASLHHQKLGSHIILPRPAKAVQHRVCLAF